MVTKADIPKGYKQTEVGIIPEDWNTFTIQFLIDRNYILSHLDGNHGELYPRSHEFKPDGIPYIGANDFSEGKVSFEHCKYLSEERAKQFKKGVARNRDVLFAHNATVGPVALLNIDLDYVILSTTATYFRCDNNNLFSNFLAYALQSSFFVKQYQAVMAQSTRFQVPITTQRKFYLIVPSKAEQQAIAEALSDVDGLITSLDELIAKKRQIKQGTMQQLLTGKKHLPGFSGEWEVKRLGQYIKFQVGFPFSSIFFNQNSQGLRLVKNRDLKSDDQVFYFDGKYRDDFLVKNGDVLIGMDGDFIPCKWNKGLGLLNQRVGRLVKSNEIDLDFLYYGLRKPLNAIENKTSSTTVKHLSHKDVENIEMPLPEMKEQSAIAEILSYMDTEIESLEIKRDKYKVIKRGMMQKLLTGRIRLV